MAAQKPLAPLSHGEKMRASDEGRVAAEQRIAAAKNRLKAANQKYNAYMRASVGSK